MIGITNTEMSRLMSCVLFSRSSFMCVGLLWDPKIYLGVDAKKYCVLGR